MRRFIFPLLVVLVLLLAGAGWYLLQRYTVTYSENSAFRAVPVRTPLVLEVRDTEQLLDWLGGGGQLAEVLHGIPALQPVLEELDELGRMLAGEKDLKALLKDRQVLVAFNPEGKDNIGCLLALSLENRISREGMTGFLKDYATRGGTELSERLYDGAKVYGLKWGSRCFYFAERDGVFLLSRHALFVEEAIRQLRAVSLLDEEQFCRLYRTAGNDSELNVFIRHETIQLLLNRAVDRNFRAALQRFGRLTGITELDLSLKGKEALLGGFSFAGPEGSFFLDALRRQEAGRFTLARMMPASVSCFLSMNLPDFSAYQQAYEEYLKGEQGSFYLREAGLKKIGAYCSKPFPELFAEVAGEEFALVLTRVMQNDPAGNRFLLASVKSRSQARELILSMLEKQAATAGKSLEELEILFRLPDAEPVPIYVFPFPELPALLLGRAFSAVDANYLCFYGNYLILADNLPALKSYMHELILSDTLERDARFRKFNDQMASRSTLYFYLNIPRSFYLKDYYLQPELAEGLGENEELLRGFYGLGWQLAGNAGEFLNSFYLLYDPASRAEPRTVWQTRLDAPLAGKPLLMRNHTDKQNREVLVQDSRHQLYLINREGVTLWKIPLPGPVLGEVHQVDYYRNKKLQYLFATREQLHLIDRNGNRVAGFPLSLRSPAGGGVALFDYDGNRDYRYFIAGEDKNIYAYNREGRPVGGWKFGGTETVLNRPVQHIRLGGKDYLVCADRYRTYMLDRQGQIRVEVAETYAHSGNGLFLVQGAKPALAATDTEGKIHLQYFDGSHVLIDAGSFGEQHYFVTAELNGDGKTDFILAEGRRLLAVDDRGEELFAHVFPGDISEKPAVFVQEGKRKIGVVCRGENSVFLLDAGGKLCPGFPLQGSTAFCMGKLGDDNAFYNLLVGGVDGSLLNYQLE
ncbi:MAG: hypothetical protein AB7D05_00780 [Mangrovibacterium sp.]